MTTLARPAGQAPLRDIFTYAMGDGATSLVMNTFFGFSMMYYTKALGLNAKWAGLAMFAVTLWDAVIDPFMGHITDNTRSRFGRRHPYMLVGGALTVLCFYAAWSVPEFFRTPVLLFWYLVSVTVLLRTAAAVFLVAHGALGFEICTEYSQRSSLQGIRNGVNMAVNLGASAIIWNVFLRGPDGTSVPENYQRMGAAFAVAGLVFILVAVFGTRKYAVDTRHAPEIMGNTLRTIARNLLQILLDPYPRTVFVFMFVLFIGVVLVTSFQMFIYVDFMKFTEWQASIVHGSTMVAAAIGSLLAAPLVRRLDKKPTIVVTMAAAGAANLMLIALFYTGLVPPGTVWKAVPVAMLLFLVFHAFYHLATNAGVVVANSMMADVSEIGRYRTGVLKDGGYSAMMLFVLKAGISVGLGLLGFCMDAIGYVPDSKTNSPEAIRNLLLMGFLGGTAISLLGLISIVRYPVNRAYMERIKAALAGGLETPLCGSCGCILTGSVSDVCPKCGEPVTATSSPPDATVTPV